MKLGASGGAPTTGESDGRLSCKASVKASWAKVAQFLEICEAEFGVSFALVEDELASSEPLSQLDDEHRAGVETLSVEIKNFLFACQKVDPGQVEKLSNVVRLPISWMQRQIYNLMQADNMPSNYHMTDILRISGTVNVEALKKSVVETVGCHQAFFITIRADCDANGVFQELAPNLPVICEVLDWRSKSIEEQASCLRREARRFREEPFDIERGPLFRFEIVRTGDEDCFLFLTIHHLISDDWSMALLHKEVADRYRRHSARLPPPKAEGNSASYFEFTQWLESWTASPHCARETAYWTRTLSSLPPLLPLPTDHPRKVVLVNQSAGITAQIDSETTILIKNIARQLSATVFSVLLAVYCVLLWRLSGQRRIPVATLVANREFEEFETTIGLFFNSIVIVTDLRPDLPFAEFASQVIRVVLAGFKRQKVPFQMLVDQLCPSRDPSYAPIAQAMFVFQNAPREVFRLGSAGLEQFGGMNLGSAYDVKLTAYEKGENIELLMEYNVDLLDQRTTRSWLDMYRSLLTSVALDANAALHQLTLVESGGGHSVPWALELDGNRENNCPDRSIGDLIAEVAERSPEDIAAVDGDTPRTYKEIAEEAELLARLISKMETVD